MVDESKMTHCPVCNKEICDLPYEICTNCGWENNDWQSEEPDLGGWANVMPLNEARKAWKEGKKVH